MHGLAGHAQGIRDLLPRHALGPRVGHMDLLQPCQQATQGPATARSPMRGSVLSVAVTSGGIAPILSMYVDTIESVNHP
jgi:hypothetical protein